MTQRNLTITLQPDWKAAIRAVGVAAKADTYQGEVLNFETPAQFFGQLSEKRWDIVRAAQGKGDHCHIDGKELPYAFTSVDQLLEDFIATIETRRAS